MTTIFPPGPCHPPHVVAKTVRELRLETLLDATLPHLFEKEFGTKTSPKLRALIDLIERETKGG
jgi:hypothetical protein